jgi:hypothetical protein
MDLEKACLEIESHPEELPDVIAGADRHLIEAGNVQIDRPIGDIDQDTGLSQFFCEIRALSLLLPW